MSKEDEYRGFAASCLMFANASGNIADKARLLAMAEAWLDLAGRASRSAKEHARQIAEHPLVRKVLGEDSGVEAE
jgi:alkylation response protein AidB-like acyl-CoA dehydrogenase